MIDRVLVQQAVIAGEQHGQAPGAVEQARRPRQQRLRYPRVVEKVPGDQDRIDVMLDGEVNRPRERSVLQTDGPPLLAGPGVSSEPVQFGNQEIDLIAGVVHSQ